MAYFDEFVVKTQLAGLSTDTKPTAVDKYSLFLELDTNKIFYYTGSAWVELGQAPTP